MTDQEKAAPPPDWAMAEAAKIVQDITHAQIDSIVGEIQAANMFDLSNLSDFYTSRLAESDRGLAIVMFAFIDDALRSIYLKVLNSAVDGGLETLVGVAGPLSSAGLRIHMASALRWIQDRTYRSLRVMQKIRNAFAHRLQTGSFEDAPIRALVDSMFPSEDLLYASSYAMRYLPKDQLSVRQKFHVRGTFACSFAIMEMASAPLAIRSGLSPMAPLARGFDRMAPLHQSAVLGIVQACHPIIAVGAASTD